jgi:hypothetical protein
VANPSVPKPPSKQGCSNDEIQYLLRRAEENRDTGQYDASIREYKAVLACDPSNLAAKQGLKKTSEDN